MATFTEERAAQVLGDEAYVHHTGGGIHAARIDFGDGAHVLVTESDGAWLVGYYADDEDEGTTTLARDEDALREAVSLLRREGVG